MATRSSVPAVEYRNLLTQLSLQLERDPENARLRQYMQDLVAIGYEAGALRRDSAADDTAIPGAARAVLDPSFDWDSSELAVSPEQDRLLAAVAEITRIPE